MSQIMQAQIRQDGQRWSVSGNVGISTATALLSSSQGFTLTGDTVVDFAEVAAIDTAAISLILEWKRRAKREQQSIVLVNLPANLKSLAEVYGVSSLVN